MNYNFGDSNIFFVSSLDTDINKLKSNKYKKYIKKIYESENKNIPINESDDVDWAAQILNINNEYNNNFNLTGEGVTIAVMDSGVKNFHSDLENNVTKHYLCSHIEDGPCEEPLFPEAVGNHGTHVAGIIAAQKNDEGNTGIAYKSKILDFNVSAFSDKNVNENNGNAVDNAYRTIYEMNDDTNSENNIDIVNMSFGIDTDITTNIGYYSVLNEKLNSKRNKCFYGNRGYHYNVYCTQDLHCCWFD
jgi:subtilisin family serine protease